MRLDASRSKVGKKSSERLPGDSCVWVDIAEHHGIIVSRVFPSGLESELMREGDGGKSNGNSYLIRGDTIPSYKGILFAFRMEQMKKCVSS